VRKFRSFISGPIGRFVTLTLLAASLHYASDPYNYLYAMEVQHAKEAEIRAIAAKLNVDPEFLLHPEGRKRFDFKSLFASLQNALGLKSEQAPQSQQPLDIQESIKRVKSRYALVAADTTLAKIAEAINVDLSKTKNKGQMKAHLNSVLRLIDKDFLPDVPDGVSGSAKSRDAQMRSAINKLRNDVRKILNEKDALEEANLEATLAKLRQAVSGELTVRKHGPRWTKDPFPLKDTYKEATKRNVGSGEPSSAPSTGAVVTNSVATKLAQTTTAAPAEVAALAAQLGTPAKIFAWVHDHIEFEPYSGVAKGSLGTLQEGRGNDWDQAILLRDMLASRGWSAQLEWGTVTMPMAKAMNLAGTEDPTQAANLLATAGFGGVVLMSGNAPVGVQMQHAWVRANIPYIPNRGATTGTADTWVRMDPSFKRYEYQAGIKINGKVAWSQDEYLNTSSIRPPADFYGDKIWSYIRANNLNCNNLAQVPKTGSIKQQNFPYVPSTLTAKIDSVGGTAVDAPADQVQSVAITIGDVLTYNARLADIWGKKLTITFAPATADDAATIAAYGGLFNTPAYLVRLKPVLSLDDQPVAEGAGVAAGADLDLNLRYHQPNVADDTTHHDLIAGETHTLVFDAGNPPDSLIESRINRLKTLTNDEAILSEKLFLVGLRYMQHIDDGVAFAAGVRWQRPVKRVFEADVRRQLDVRYNLAGAPLRLVPAENNIDVARLLVGIVPIDNDLSNRAEALQLAGLQSSYLEGSVWEEMESQQGISATKALLLARLSGQTLQTVTSANVDAVLANASLSSEVEEEIRGAVAQGRTAKIAPNEISLGHWTGTGYILQDTTTGAATYPISGGLAGGSTTGDILSGLTEMLGSESWLEGSPFGVLIAQLRQLFGGGNPNGNQSSTTQGDPVNMSSGNMHRAMTDVSVVARGIPVGIARTYNSRSGYNGPFGYGWTWSYGEELIANADGTVTYRESDGSEHAFTRDASGVYHAPAGKHVALTGGASGWTLQLQDGLQLTFDSQGRLASQIDRNGNTVTVQRDAAGLPVAVVDAGNRTVLTFTTSAGKVTRVTDLGGRVVTYAYDGDDLTSVADTAGKTWSMTYDLGHNMTSFADPLGNTQSYDYDNDDRLFRHTDATGADESFQYDIAGRQSVVTDRRGGDRLIRFDDLGRATMEADPAGNVATSTFDADNNRTRTVDSRGLATTYEFDATGNVTRQVNPDGGVATTTYDADARPLTTTDAVGVTTTRTYDANGNILTSSRTVGSVTETTTNTYDSSGQQLTTTDPNGGVSSMTWNANGTIATRTDALQHTSTLTGDALGRITSILDPGQNKAELTYEGRGQVATVKDPQGSISSFGYDDAGRRATLTTPRGTTRYTYDAEGRVTAVTDALGNTNRVSYNAAGDVLAKTDARGNTTRYEYDLAGRVTKMVDANGGVWTYGYCGAVGGGGGASCATCGGAGASFCELTDPSGNTLRQQFDNMGRVVAVSDALGHMLLTEYDKEGRKTRETDANGNATQFGYDEAGRLLFVKEASGAVTNYTYDKNGNKLSQKDANGHLWSYKYDGLNRLIEESDPLSRKTTYAYDAVGNLKTKTDAKGQTTTYGYNVHRLTGVAYSDGTSDSFTYDAQGRRLTAANANVTIAYGYDALNRITSMTNQRYNLVARYEYDAAGNRSKMITPQSTATYTYDAKNRLTQISDSMFGAFRFGYDGMDRRKELKYPNGIVTSYTYDNAYRLSAMVAKDAAGAVVDAWSYQYDAVGNRTSKTDLNGKAETYRYDSVYRLLESSYADGSFEKFTYDPAGNRLGLTTPAGVTNYTYDVANQLTGIGAEGRTYDANGNLLTIGSGSTFTYDVNNRPITLATPGGTERNLYDAEGRRVDMAGASIENGQVRVFYDLSRNPILDWGTDNQTWTYRLYGPGMDEALAEYRRTNNRITYLHQDGLGSVAGVSNPSGQLVYRSTYKAFGSMSRTSYDVASTRLGYTGRETSVSGLMQYRSRYYDPAVGRFLQQDTDRGSDVVPPSLHRYTYVHNNPVRYADPMGTSVLGNFADAGKLIVAYYAVVFSFMLITLAYIRCLMTPQNFGSCVVAFLGVWLSPIIGFGENMLELALSAWEVFYLWRGGDLDDLGFFLVLFAMGMAAMLQISVGLWLASKDVQPSVALGIASVGMASLTAQFVDWAKDANMQATALGAY